MSKLDIKIGSKWKGCSGTTFTIEAKLSNGDYASTFVDWLGNGYVCSITHTEEYIKKYCTEIKPEDWRAIFIDRNRYRVGRKSYKSEEEVYKDWEWFPHFIRAVKVSH